MAKELYLRKEFVGWGVGFYHGIRSHTIIVVRRPWAVNRILPGLRYLLKKQATIKEMKKYIEGARIWAKARGELI